ncbi:MAG: PP2C family protein-serine/threonine phosphatase, partial [Thermoguttaceae bacterium]|nr:PP2C family protein-serine/threonine phosphatase [Thermoguttaceae bacterium]
SGKPFTPDDLDLLISIANQMAVYQENLKYQDVQIQRKMMSQEMNVAHKVQKGFLPAEPPQIPGFEFYDYYQPAKFLGGDYFDYVPLGNGLLAVALGDVSGKGISASLLMAKLSSEVRYSLLLEKSLPKTMEHLNRVYSENHWGDRFITFILLVIDLKTREIHLCNAGHVYPILSKTNGEIMEIGVDRNGFPLGIVPDAQYEEIIFTLEDGELVSLMSDGITDATNAQGENYGIQRVYERLANHDGIGAGEMGQRLISSVREFAGQMPQADDQCLVIFGRTTNGGDTDETENSLS